MKARWLFLAFLLGGVAACPLSAQTSIRYCNVTVQLPPGHPKGPVVDTAQKIVADSTLCLRTSGGSVQTQMRNRFAIRGDSLSRQPYPVVADTLWCNALGICAIEPPPAVPQDTLVIPIPPDPPTGEQFDSTLVGSYVGLVVVPDSQVWKVGPDVRMRGNLVTSGGAVAFRPGSHLTFVGADPNKYVGGGMMYGPEFANDFGLWIGTNGTLDVQCTAKETWNREGSNSSWLSTDELWVAPVAVGDFLPKRYTMGQPVPRASEKVLPAEVVNVTRDCSVTGPAHIHIHSTKKQTIQYLALRNMGVSNVASKGPVLGRYGLHLHMSSGGASIIGVVSIGAGGKVFVPHASPNVVMSDVAAVNSRAECFWWDFGQDTNDIKVDRLGCLGVQMPDSIGGGQSNYSGVELPSGQRMSMCNSFASGVTGGQLAVGFNWPEPTTVFGTNPHLIWDPWCGNVAHNNRGPGLRFWTNNQDAHVNTDYIGYRNGGGCIENGAYFTGTEYHRVTCFEDGYVVGNDLSVAPAGVHQNASNATNSAGRPGIFEDATIGSLQGPAILVEHRQLPGDPSNPIIYRNVTLIPAPGQPKVRVGPGDHPWFARFEGTAITPAEIDIQPSSGNEGTRIEIGPKCVVTFVDQQKRTKDCP